MSGADYDLIAALTAGLGLSYDDAGRLVRAAEPLWDETATLGWTDIYGGAESKRVLPAALAFIRREANLPPPTEPFWVNVGDAYGLVVGGRIIGLAYSDGAKPGTDEQGEPWIVEGGWYAVHIEQPQQHFHIGEGEVGADAPAEDALPVAARHLLDRPPTVPERGQAGAS